MEQSFAIFFLLVFIAWHVLAIRKSKNSNEFSTTLWLNIESQKSDERGISLENCQLRKKIDARFSIVPGMEWSEPGERIPLLVERVIFESRAQGVHLKCKRVPAGEFEATINAWIKSGWQDGH